MEQHTYIVTFEHVSAADASRYAGELRQVLLDASPDLEVQRRRDNPETQDIGTTLILILGTPAAAAATTAIGNWLARRNRASITITTDNGEMVVQNISSKNAYELAKLHMSHK